MNRFHTKNPCREVTVPQRPWSGHAGLHRKAAGEWSDDQEAGSADGSAASGDELRIEISTVDSQGKGRIWSECWQPWSISWLWNAVPREAGPRCLALQRFAPLKAWEGGSGCRLTSDWRLQSPQEMLLCVLTVCSDPRVVSYNDNVWDSGWPRWQLCTVALHINLVFSQLHKKYLRSTGFQLGNLIKFWAHHFLKMDENGRVSFSIISLKNPASLLGLRLNIDSPCLHFKGMPHKGIATMVAIVPEHFHGKVRGQKRETQRSTSTTGNKELQHTDSENWKNNSKKGQAGHRMKMNETHHNIASDCLCP